MDKKMTSLCTKNRKAISTFIDKRCHNLASMLLQSEINPFKDEDIMVEDVRSLNT